MTPAHDPRRRQPRVRAGQGTLQRCVAAGVCGVITLNREVNREADAVQSTLQRRTCYFPRRHARVTPAATRQRRQPAGHGARSRVTIAGQRRRRRVGRGRQHTSITEAGRGRRPEDCLCARDQHHQQRWRRRQWQLPVTSPVTERPVSAAAAAALGRPVGSGPPRRASAAPPGRSEQQTAATLPPHHQLLHRPLAAPLTLPFVHGLR